MTTTSMQDIITLCHTVMTFQRKHDWRFKAMPVISWEFADLGDFMDARATLERAVHAARSYYETMPSPSGVGRILSPHTIEIDLCGITFRLTCIATRDTIHGPIGAAEMKRGPDFQVQPPLSFNDIFGPPKKSP